EGHLGPPDPIAPANGPRLARRGGLGPAAPSLPNVRVLPSPPGDSRRHPLRHRSRPTASVGGLGGPRDRGGDSHPLIVEEGRAVGPSGRLRPTERPLAWNPGHCATIGDRFGNVLGTRPRGSRALRLLEVRRPRDGNMRKIDALGIPLALGGGTTGGLLATQTAIGSGPLAGVTAVTMGIAGAL